MVKRFDWQEMIVVIALAALMVMGIIWLFWKIWLAVVPQVWTTGPDGFISPSYWLFFGMYFLVGVVARLWRKA